ncbi:hypothetical protein [Mesorhizobium kowhaii]|uniref:hypothetical protein n=1 Tax=Mesorhizobium kowhaii TaxID=1300272 RepID=UPI003671366D
MRFLQDGGQDFRQSASSNTPESEKAAAEKRVKRFERLTPTLETSISANAALSESPLPESEMINTVK